MIKPAEDLKSVLPPNTCFETAFTSESPVTRIVPQSSFDTLHLSSAGSSMKRNASAPKLLETCGLGAEADYSQNKSSIYKSPLFAMTNDKFSTIGGIRWQSKSKSKADIHSGSLQIQKTEALSISSESQRSRSNHSCGKLIVTDKTPPLPPRHLTKPPPVYRNVPKEAKVCI